MIRLLVSCRTLAEAQTAARGGADFIDLKEPRDGALGGLPVATIEAIVRALRRDRHPPISATIGDLPMTATDAILAQVDAVAACGVDYVKVGIERTAEAAPVLDALAACGRPTIPVFIADRGLDAASIAQACRLGFPALMVDTADKRAGSLFDLLPMDVLQRFVEQVRASGRQVGLAGALRRQHLSTLRALAPDFAGFRSAVCARDRGGAMEAPLLAELVRAMTATGAASVV